MLNSYKTNTLSFDSSVCTGCKMCLAVCPHAVFAAQNGSVALEHQEACMECGACMLNCAPGAIKVESGVGCAAAMMWAALRGKEEASCGGSCS